MAIARALQAPRIPAAAAALLAAAALAVLPAGRASAEDGGPGALRFGESMAVPCTLRARAAGGDGEAAGPALPQHDRCEALLEAPERPAAPFDARASWDGAYRGVDIAAGVRVRAFADDLPTPGAEDSLALGGALRFRGLTVDAAYVGDRFAHALGYGIGATYRFGPFRVGAGLAETRPERQARPDEAAPTGRTLALDLEYSFLPALRGFVEYLSVAPASNERPDPSERDSVWAIGLTLGF